METWDLTSPATKLSLAMQSLQDARADALEHWHDETSRNFQEQYMDPLEPLVKETLDAAQRLAKVMAGAHRECSSY